MITSRLTSKAQTTIPQAVRTALGLQAGDQVAYVLDGGRVTLTRHQPRRTQGDPFASFSEWAGEADSEAYIAL